MILQALEYEELENTPGRLQDFYDSTAGMAFVCMSFLWLSGCGFFFPSGK